MARLLLTLLALFAASAAARPLLAVQSVESSSSAVHTITAASNLTIVSPLTVTTVDNSTIPCQTVEQVLYNYNLTTITKVARRAGPASYANLTAPGQTIVVPLQSAFYRYGATRNSDAFSDSALNAAPPNTAYADLIRYCIIPVPIKCTCDLADQQQLTTSLPGAPPLTVFIDPSNPATVLLTSTFGHSQIVRKNILVCGGGSVQVTDAVIPPYAM